MKRFAIVSVLALAACAGEPEPPVAVAPPAAPAAAAPVEPVAVQPPPPPVATAPLPAPAVTGMSPHHMRPAKDPRTLVYLASYKTEASAKAGFQRLAKASPILARQQARTQNVDLGKKGKWVRLYGLAADEAERSKICKQVAKLVDECGARNRE